MIDLGLKDKTAIVTGGSDGLGRATAKLLAAEGRGTGGSHRYMQLQIVAFADILG